MSSIVAVSRDALETLAAFRFPPQLVKRLQELMDRNNDGLLTASEQEVMEGLVEMRDDIGLQRTQLWILLKQNAS